MGSLVVSLAIQGLHSRTLTMLFPSPNIFLDPIQLCQQSTLQYATVVHLLGRHRPFVSWSADSPLAVVHIECASSFAFSLISLVVVVVVAILTWWLSALDVAGCRGQGSGSAPVAVGF